MKIAIIGYGKMGKTIEKLALTRGHEIVLKINSSTSPTLTIESLKAAAPDVAIEFTSPSSAYDNISTAIRAGIPTVSGSTGWLDEWEKVIQLLQKSDAGFLYASNFSVGVNIFFAVNRYVSKIMNDYPSYQPQITEIHHTAKVDAPSGTAVTLANDLIGNIDHIADWSPKDQSDNSLFVKSIREDPAPGTHVVQYTSVVDDIEIKHTAKSRDGFAYGAVLAAEYLKGKSGLHTMKDVLGI